MREPAASASFDPATGDPAEGDPAGLDPAVIGSSVDSATVGYRARFDECGPDALLRASTLLRWAQDIAWIHSERLGFGREWYATRKLAWLVRGLELTVLAPLAMGVTAEVVTRVTGFRRVLARRRTEFRLPDGILAARATTDWAMTDAARGMPTRIPTAFPALFSAGTERFAPIRVPEPPPGYVERPFVVRRHELDPMAHANNAVYVDWLEEAIAAAGGAEVLTVLPRSYRLEYLLPAEPAAELMAVSRAEGPGWQVQILDRAGRVLLRGTLTAV